MAQFLAFVPLKRTMFCSPTMLEYHNRALQKIRTHGLTIDCSQLIGNASHINISVLENSPKRLADFLNSFDPYGITPHPKTRGPLLQFSTECKYPGTIYESHPINNEKSIKYSKKLSEWFWRNVTLDEFVTVIRYFLVSTNIARPGALTGTVGIAYSGRRAWKKVPATLSLLEEAFELSLDVEWPKVEELDFQSCWDWFSAQPGLTQGLTNSSISRAIAAFTYVFGESYQDRLMGDLIWSLAGLESLYARGQQGVMEQLIAKGFCFLGHPSDIKRITSLIKSMYNYRSRLVHGDRNIIAHFSEDIDANLEGKRGEESFDANRLAVIALAASLQKCALENRTSLEFDYTIRK